MKIGIISDIHENFHNLLLFKEEVKKQNLDVVICLGDMINAGIGMTLNELGVPTYLIWGNNDGNVVKIVKISCKEGSNLEVLSDTTYGFLELDNKKFFLTHYPDIVDSMAKSQDYDCVFYGHTHKSEVRKVEKCLVVNPGEIACSKGKIASFAIYDTQEHKVEIIEINDSISTRTPLVNDFLENLYSKKNKSKIDKSDLSPP